MIIGLAGHIDHGKTTLVRVLTGVDTDRLRDEKARGITIDLGFAYMPASNGGTIGFVDVPGHERFVHTMIAGAASIDCALLVVAANDGAMPQTREHLQILQILGIDRGAVVVTKTDLVGRERVDALREELRTLLAPTPLSGSPVFLVSAKDGSGLPTLRNWIDEQASSRRATAGLQKAFRLAVDRCFTLAGAGTVVTGSVIAGEISVGDEVLVMPVGRLARVRSLHAMNQPAIKGVKGDRCALNLKGSGVGPDSVARGDWALAPTHPAVSRRCDVLLHLLPENRRAMKQWAAVRLHHGARRLDARVVLLEHDTLQPGQQALAQIVTSTPLPFRWSDRVILRDPSAQHTVAGARIVDPFAPDRNRRRPERLALLRALSHWNEADAFTMAISASPHLLNVGELEQGWGLTTAGIDSLAGTALRLSFGREVFLTSPATLAELQVDMIGALADLHARHPARLGVSAAALRNAMGHRLSRACFEAVAGHLVAASAVVTRNGLLALPDHEPQVPAEIMVLRADIRELLSKEPFGPPCVSDMAKAVPADEPVVRRACKHLAHDGIVIEVAPDHFYLRRAISDALAAVGTLSERTHGGFTVVQFREFIGSGRRSAVLILNYFDRRGITKRREGKRWIAREPALRWEDVAEHFDGL